MSTLCYHLRVIAALMCMLFAFVIGSWYQMRGDKAATIEHCERYQAMRIDGVLYVCYRKESKA